MKSFFLTLVGLSLATAYGHTDSVLGIHGSGTTNPSKCYWAIMEQMEDRAKIPLHNTYRAVGSTTGIAEFLNNEDYSMPVNDFGSGDLPLNETVYQALTTRGIEIVHLPVLLGAVSFFHSAPVEKLNLTACLLARILKRDITEWDHADLGGMNPEFKSMTNLPPIKVGRRVLGSSSTDSITKYLHAACPDVWPESLTGSTIDWPEDTEKCEGSSGMTKCINDFPGTIGYIDAGHGISAGLKEIELENMFGTIQSSEEAASMGGIIAAEAGVLPEKADMDFSTVSLLNRPGQYTWPIVQLTYIYVRKDLTYIEDPQAQTLLVAFLRALFELPYIQQCVDNYGFTLPSEGVRQFALDGISMLVHDENATAWTFEDETMPVTGQGDFVISSMRKSISSVERSDLMSLVADLEVENSMLKANMETLMASSGMTDKQETQLLAALVLSSISFSLVILFMCASALRFSQRGSTTIDTNQIDEGDAIQKQYAEEDVIQKE